MEEENERKGPLLVAAPQNYLAVIKVVGIGGGGVNAVNRMIEEGLKGVEFIAINTDAQALLMSDADVKLDVGRQRTRCEPGRRRQGREDHREEIEEVLKGADLDLEHLFDLLAVVLVALAPTSGFAPAPSPRVSSLPTSSLTSASLIRRACASVLIAMNSTPLSPSSIMRLTALTPPPPIPTTLMTAR